MLVQWTEIRDKNFWASFEEYWGNSMKVLVSIPYLLPP